MNANFRQNQVIELITHVDRINRIPLKIRKGDKLTACKHILHMRGRLLEAPAAYHVYGHENQRCDDKQRCASERGARPCRWYRAPKGESTRAPSVLLRRCRLPAAQDRLVDAGSFASLLAWQKPQVVKKTSRKPHPLQEMAAPSAPAAADPNHKTSADYYFNSYAHFGIHEVRYSLCCICA